MKNIFCVLTVIVLLPGCWYPRRIEARTPANAEERKPPKTEERKPVWNDILAGMIWQEEKWSDKHASFTLRVYEGTAELPFVAKLTIGNKTERTLTFPLPMVMPLCGETNKNCIRVYDKDGKRLEMYGWHLDFVAMPLVEIPGNSNETWHFVLDKRFPRMKEPGEFSVEFWYYAVKEDKASWIGRVNMKRLTIVRRIALKERTKQGDE